MPNSPALVLKVTDQNESEITIKFSSFSEPVVLEGICYEIVAIQKGENSFLDPKGKPSKIMVGSFEVVHDACRQHECRQTDTDTLLPNTEEWPVE